MPFRVAAASAGRDELVTLVGAAMEPLDLDEEEDARTTTGPIVDMVAASKTIVIVLCLLLLIVAWITGATDGICCRLN